MPGVSLSWCWKQELWSTRWMKHLVYCSAPRDYDLIFGFLMYVGFLLFLMLLKTSLCPWWSDRRHGIISIFLYLLRSVLWPIIWSVMEKVAWGAEKKVYSFDLGRNVLYILNAFGPKLLLISLCLCFVWVSPICPLRRVGCWSLPQLLFGVWYVL